MNRRAIIAGIAGFSMAGQPWAQASPPYRMTLIGGNFDGAAWQAGVAIDLGKGWKTYWRMPGEAGIPPRFDWTKSKGVSGVEVLYPLPRRLHDLSGETVGYERRVVFPVIVTPAANAAEVRLHLDLFFAVCKDICIPANAQATLLLTSASTPDTGMVDGWIEQVPVPGTAVRAVNAAMDSKVTVLVVKLIRPVDDIFVESTSSAYFRKPVLSPDGLEARLVADNVKDAAQLVGLSLHLTIAADGSGIEQTVTVE